MKIETDKSKAFGVQENQKDSPAKPIKVDKSEGAVEKLRSRAEELRVGWQDEGIDVKELSHRYADLEGDFNHVVEVNRYVSDKYNIFASVLPTVKEINVLIDAINVNKDGSVENILGYGKELVEDRIHKMKLLKSACVALEAQGKNKIIKKYEPKTAIKVGKKQ